MGPRHKAVMLFGVGAGLLLILVGGVLVFSPGDTSLETRAASASQRPLGPTRTAPPGASTAGPSSATASNGLPAPPASPTPSTTPSSGLSASPGPGSSQAPRFVAGADGISFIGPDGTVVPVPPVPGLSAVLRSGRLTYAALASNPYGLRSGAYAGEFKPNVTTQRLDGSSAQTGGAVLVGPVVARLVADRFAATEVAGDRWVVALPVDIRSVALASTVAVSFDSDGLRGSARVLVEFPGTLPVVNASPGNGGYHVLVEQVDAAGWQCIDPARLGSPADTIDAAHPMRSLVTYGTATPIARHDVRVDSAVPVGRRMLDAARNVSVSLVARDGQLAVGPDRVLSLGDVPIFVAAGS